MVTPGTYDLVIYQGADFSLALTWRADTGARVDSDAILDLTGYTASLQCRPTATSNELLLEMSTRNGRITLNNVAPNIVIFVNAAEMDGLTWTQGVYDLRLTSPDDQITRLIQGNVFLSRNVSR